MKTKYVILVLSLGLVLCLGYIGYREYQNYKIQVIQKSYNAGMEMALWQIIQQADPKVCKPINISNGKDIEINLINIECLNPKNNQGMETNPEWEVKEEK